jgi:hypothetical protein
MIRAMTFDPIDFGLLTKRTVTWLLILLFDTGKDREVPVGMPEVVEVNQLLA